MALLEDIQSRSLFFLLSCLQYIVPYVVNFCTVYYPEYQGFLFALSRGGDFEVDVELPIFNTFY